MEALNLGRLLLGIEIKELHCKYENGVWWDIWGSSLGSVAHLGRDRESGFGSFVELADAFVPSLDHLTDTNLAFERRSTDRRVELFAVSQLTSIVDFDHRPGRTIRSRPLLRD